MLAQTKIFTVLFNQLINFHFLITSPTQPSAGLLKTGLFSLLADQLCILINCMLPKTSLVIALWLRIPLVNHVLNFKDDHLNMEKATYLLHLRVHI